MIKTTPNGSRCIRLVDGKNIKGVATRFGLNVYYTSPSGVTTLTESWTDLSMDPTDKYFFRSVVNSSSAVITIPTTGLDVTKFPYTTATLPTAIAVAVVAFADLAFALVFL